MATSPYQDPESLEKLLFPILDELGNDEIDFPPFSQVPEQILAFINTPDPHSTQLATLIEQDPILTSRLFQLTHSAAPAPLHPIESLAQALTCLELHPESRKALFVSAPSGMFQVGRYQQEVEDLWRHAVATGLYGRLIAAQLGREQDTAYLCGLLHSIGKLFVIHTLNRIRKDFDTSLSWATINTLINKSYKEVGRQLGERWGFPFPVREAISHHEDFSFHLATSPTKGAVITCLARLLASNCLGQEVLSDDVIQKHVVVQDLNLSQEHLTRLFNTRKSIQAQVADLPILNIHRNFPERKK